MTDTPRNLVWRKALRSVAGGECVEIAQHDDYNAVRDSKNPDRHIRLTRAALRALFDAAKSGRLDFH